MEHAFFLPSPLCERSGVLRSTRVVFHIITIFMMRMNIAALCFTIVLIGNAVAQLIDDMYVFLGY